MGADAKLSIVSKGRITETGYENGLGEYEKYADDGR